MSTYKRCVACHGSGTVMGGGMMIKDCHVCDGNGKTKELDHDDFDIIKNTKSYKIAKKRLQTKYPDMTEEKTEEILNESLQQQICGTKNGRESEQRK